MYRTQLFRRYIEYIRYIALPYVIACLTSLLLTLVFTIMHSDGGPHQDFHEQLEGKAYKLVCIKQLKSQHSLDTRDKIHL